MLDNSRKGQRPERAKGPCGLAYWNRAFWIGATRSHDAVIVPPDLTLVSDELLAYALALCIQELKVSRRYLWCRSRYCPEEYENEDDLQDLLDELRMEFSARGYNASHLEELKYQIKSLTDYDRALAYDVPSEVASEISSSFEIYRRAYCEIESEANGLRRAEGRRWKHRLRETNAVVAGHYNDLLSKGAFSGKVRRLRRPKFNTLLKTARAIFRNAPETRTWFDIGASVATRTFASSWPPVDISFVNAADSLPAHYADAVPWLAVIEKLARAPSAASMVMKLRNELPDPDEPRSMACWFDTQVLWNDMEILGGLIVHCLLKVGGGKASACNRSAGQNYAQSQSTDSVKRLKLTLLKDKGMVVRDRAHITMTRPMHWKLLQLLVKSEASFVTKEDLIAEVWEDPETGFVAFHSTLTHVRRALRPLKVTISCLRGIGYQLAAIP